MGNRCNDYYLLLGNQELERVEGIWDLQERSSGGVFGRAPVECLVELRWSSSGRSCKRAKRGPAYEWSSGKLIREARLGKGSCRGKHDARFNVWNYYCYLFEITIYYLFGITSLYLELRKRRLRIGNRL
jgi:hypothetical protein